MKFTTGSRSTYTGCPLVRRTRPAFLQAAYCCWAPQHPGVTGRRCSRWKSKPYHRYSWEKINRRDLMLDHRESHGKIIHHTLRPIVDFGRVKNPTMKIRAIYRDKRRWHSRHERFKKEKRKKSIYRSWVKHSNRMNSRATFIGTKVQYIIHWRHKSILT